MGIGNSFLLQHFSDAVWAIKPERLQVMAEVLLQKLDGGSVAALSAVKDLKREDSIIQRDGTTAILNMEGVLVPKASGLDAMCGMMGTIDLHNKFNMLVQDKSVERIVCYFNGPGGAVIGIPEFANSIFEARSEKEIVGFTDVMACSAHEYLFAACEHRVASKSAMIGSIGVYSTIIKNNTVKDSTGQVLNKNTVHIISAGAKKVFGHPDVAITQEEIDYYAESVAESYELFTSDVARFTGASQDEVKSTEAAYYYARNAPSWMLTDYGDANYVLS